LPSKSHKFPVLSWHLVLHTPREATALLPVGVSHAEPFGLCCLVWG
jgi:hypothetical protein